ncbi:MAG: cupin [Candidatus Contendobacter odensis]|uniref:Cupin n=1 Tax=Candidatus Contendibacter odensensis TaxID=1400860 RepID=A0A2G6PFG0_9GAMM|nr:MAG: cupin [Candidatus Contendobacter odensis]
MKKKEWLVFQLPELLAKINPDNLSFQEFLRTPSLSCAIYHLPANSKEMQRAHEEDELYLVLKGRGRLRIGDKEHVVQKDTLMYIHAACDHAFFDIEEDLTVLAFFGAVRHFFT